MLNKIKSFASFIKENEEKRVVFTFGRMNPPTVGHGKLLDKIASVAKGDDYAIYLSKTHDKKKNPLSYEQKLKFARSMFPTHARKFIEDKTIATAINVLVALYKQGYAHVTMVVGSDRINEFKALLNKYNGVEARHGIYNFKSIDVVSAGDRDPDSDGVSGMSASKMRGAAMDNDFIEFSKGLPQNYKQAKDLFMAVRDGMGLKEDHNYKPNIKFECDEIRERYINNEIFKMDEMVKIKESNEIGKIQYRGNNYVILNCEDRSAKRVWLKDIQSIED